MMENKIQRKKGIKIINEKRKKKYDLVLCAICNVHRIWVRTTNHEKTKAINEKNEKEIVVDDDNTNVKQIRW